MMRLFTFIGIAAVLISAPPINAEERTLKVDDITLHYTVHGDGPPLLLLHGLSTTGQDAWRGLIPGLEKHFKLYVPDLRGHGKSTFSDKLFTHKLVAQDMLVFLEKLQIDRARAIGASSGANALLHLAVLAPERIRSMVLVVGGHYMPEEGRDTLRNTIKQTDVEERFSKLHAGGERQWDYIRRSTDALCENYTDMNFSPPLLGTIKTRTLIVHGDRDEFFPIHLPVQLYQALPNAQLWIIPNKGHMLIYPPGAEKETERLFLQRTIRFLEKVEPSATPKSR